MNYFRLKIKNRDGEWIDVEQKESYEHLFVLDNPSNRYDPNTTSPGLAEKQLVLPNTPHNSKLFDIPMSDIHAGFKKDYEARLILGEKESEGMVRLINANCDTLSINFLQSMQTIMELFGNDTLKNVLQNECELISDIVMEKAYYFDQDVPSVSIAGVIYTADSTLATISLQANDLINQIVNDGIILASSFFSTTITTNRNYINFIFEINTQDQLFNYKSFEALEGFENYFCYQQSSNLIEDVTPTVNYMNNQITLPNNQITHQFFPIFDPCLFDGNIENEYMQFVNYYNDGTFVLDTMRRFPMIPFFKTAYIFEKIFEYYDIEILGDIQNEACWHDLFELNNNLDNNGVQYLFGANFELTDREYPFYFQVCDYVKADKPVDFIRDTAHRLGYKFEFIRGRKAIRFVKYSDTGKNGNKISIPRGFMVKDSIKKSVMRKKGGFLIKEPNTTSTDKYLELATAPILEDFGHNGGNGKVITYRLAAANHYLGPNLDTGDAPESTLPYNWKIPQWWVVANTNLENIGVNDFHRTIMIYSGMADSELAEEQYPLASNDGRDFNDVIQLDCSLDMADANSFFQRNFYPFLKKLDIRATATLNIVISKDFSPELTDCCTVIIANLFGTGNAEYLIKQVKAGQDGKTGVGIATVILIPYKHIYPSKIND